MPEPSHRVFISATAADKPLADQIAARLRSEGLKVVAPEDTQGPGEDIVDGIEKAMAESSVILLVVSPDSLDSKWSNFELGLALSQAQTRPGKRLVPVLTPDLPWEAIPTWLRNRDGIRASRDDIEGLVESLKQTVP